MKLGVCGGGCEEDIGGCEGYGCMEEGCCLGEGVCVCMCMRIGWCEGTCEDVRVV